MNVWKILSQTGQDGDRIAASEKAVRNLLETAEDQLRRTVVGKSV